MTGITKSEATAARVAQEHIRTEIGWFTVWMTRNKGKTQRKYYLNEIKECMKRYNQFEKILDDFDKQTTDTQRAMDKMREYFPTAMGS